LPAEGWLSLHFSAVFHIYKAIPWTLLVFKIGKKEELVIKEKKNLSAYYAKGSFKHYLEMFKLAFKWCTAKKLG